MSAPARVVTVTAVEGTGNGDELFAPALQVWETRTVRSGLLRRRREVTCWWTVEVADPFIPERVQMGLLAISARARGLTL